MEAYANALLFAIPIFMLLVLAEIIYGHFKGMQTYTFMDTISSLSSGLTNIIKDSLGLVLILVSYPYLKSELSLLTIESSIWVYIIAFICIDFSSYWNHRLNHKINFFWNQHIIHHSSEEFNLACALRQSISNLLGYTAIFLIPAAFLGIPQEVINVLAPLHLFGQFWYHTQHIGKLGFLEYIFVTPSQHRVHHAINPIYIDKNLAAIFCIWDRLFGTFQEELEEEPPVFGVLKPVKTWNPIIINFKHLWGLFVDAWRTKRWKDKFVLWLKPTGWRPEDVKKKYPSNIIEDVFALKKYSTRTSKLLKFWALFQLVSTNIMLFIFLFNFSEFYTIQKWLFSFIILLCVFSYTALMDGYDWALKFQYFINTSGILFFLYPSHKEFYLNLSPLLYYFSIIYFLISFIIVLFLSREKNNFLENAV